MYSERTSAVSILRRILLFAMALFLLVTCFYIKGQPRFGEWIPAFSGFWDLNILTETGERSVIYGISGIVLVLFSTYMVGRQLLVSVSSSFLTVCIAAVLILLDPRSIYFSSIYPAAICIIWSVFCLLEQQTFTEFFLLSLGALFYAPLLWMIPIVLLIVLFGGNDSFRRFVKALGGVIVPAIFLLSFRYLRFDDVEVFCGQIWSCISNFGSSFLSLHFVSMFMIVCLVFMGLHAMLLIMREIGHNSISVSKTLRIESLALLLTSALFFLFSGVSSAPVSVLLASPFALLLSNYYTNFSGKDSVKIQIVLFFCVIIIDRLGYFVN